MKLKTKFTISQLFFVLVINNAMTAKTFREFPLSAIAMERGVCSQPNFPFRSQYKFILPDRNRPENPAERTANFINYESDLTSLDTNFTNQKTLLIMNTATPANNGRDVQD